MTLAEAEALLRQYGPHCHHVPVRREDMEHLVAALRRLEDLEARTPPVLIPVPETARSGACK